MRSEYKALAFRAGYVQTGGLCSVRCKIINRHALQSRILERDDDYSAE